MNYRFLFSLVEKGKLTRDEFLGALLVERLRELKDVKQMAIEGLKDSQNIESIVNYIDKINNVELPNWIRAAWQKAKNIETGMQATAMVGLQD